MKRSASIEDFLKPIREKPYQAYLFIEKSGLVTRFNLVLDHKATNKTLKLWAFITQVITTTYLADNHSKVLLVKSERGEVVSIITSQNLTRGNRSESAVVTTDPDIFATLQSQIEDLIKNHSVPLNDLFSRAIAAD